MTQSSGQRAYAGDVAVTCSRCHWGGAVEVHFDPEIALSGWDCPRCDYSNNERMEG